MSNQQFRNVTYLSDRSGTGKWRIAWPIQQLDCIAQQTGVQADYSQTPITQPEFYRGVNSVTVQRWISPQQRDLFCKFLKPLMDQSSGWLHYEIDDLMFDGRSYANEQLKSDTEEKFKDFGEKGIPKFNRGRKAFEGQEVQSQIYEMLNSADFVRVTTDFLKDVYHTIYGVPEENIIALPNFLPRYLFADRYDPERSVKMFGANKARPRIGIVSSLSHYNVDKARQDKDGKVCRMQKAPDGSEKWVNEDNVEVKFEDTLPIIDDIDEIADMIRATVKDFQWVMFGFCPPCLQDLADKKLIEVHGGVPIMNYPSMFANLRLQAVVAPIAKTLFNACKSFIKYMECSALGIPCYARNFLPYSRVMPKDQLYDTADELKEKLTKLKFTSSNVYKDKIERQWRWLNSPCHEGSFDIVNFWLEDNLNLFIDLNRMRQKAIKVSLSAFSQSYEQRKIEAEKNVIFKNDNILITK